MGCNQEFEVFSTPIKSPNDKNEYKVIRLKNGLTVCLISDTHAIKTAASESNQKMAAASLCVSVGSFSDPKNILGMAHFLEHMVFMGSQKFPEENNFDGFITKRGGSNNAFTDREHTLFYFECLEKDFTEALDRFAQFFISPLMLKSSITKERNIVDSEFQMELPDDMWRREQLIASFAKSDSPANGFSCGNLLTLKDNITEDELYAALHEFRKRHYSANRMTLAVQAQVPLEQLQSYVLEHFNSIPSNGLPPDDFSQFTNVFDTQEFAKMYYVEPVNEIMMLKLTWALPSLLHKYKSKPQLILASNIGDEGKGSLLSYFKKKVWALGLMAGVSEGGGDHNSMYAVFEIYITLTKEGLNHIYEIIEAVFSYMNMLKKLGPQERVYEERKIISDTSFRFETEETAATHVQTLSRNMHLYPPEDYITGPQLLFEYEPDFIETVLSYLTPHKMNVIVSCNDLPSGLTYDKTEKWFGVKHTEQEIPEHWLEKWEEAVPLDEFSIPLPNQFLTEDFTIVEEDEDHPDYPERILRTDLLEVWYRKDQKFKLPNAHYNFCLINPIMLETPKTSVLLDLYVNLLLVSLAEETYPASQADLSYSLYSCDKGLQFTVSGFNEKLHVLIQLIARCFQNYKLHVTEEIFSAVKEYIIRYYHNCLLKPSYLAMDVQATILVNKSHSLIDKYNVASSITFEDMTNFSEALFKNLFIKALVQGNVAKERALNVVNEFVETLNCGLIDPQLYPYYRTRQLPEGQNVCMIQSFNTKDSNSVIHNYYQSEPFSLTNSVTIEILMLTIKEDLYNTLRTNEKLGYDVGCFKEETYGILGFSIYLTTQVNKNTTYFIDERIEEFVKQVCEHLENMTEETFETTKSDLIKTKSCVDVHLGEEVYRNWDEIVNDHYMFDRIKQEIAEIGKLKLDGIRKWWRTYTFGHGQDNCRKLSIQVTGYDSDENKLPIEDNHGLNIKNPNVSLNFVSTEASTSANECTYRQQLHIKDLTDFKENLYLHPILEKNIFTL